MRAWVECVGWGAVAGAGYGLLILSGISVSTLAGAATDPNEWAGIAVFGVYAAYLAVVWGGLMGAAYGAVSGVPIAVVMTTLSRLIPFDRPVLLRVLGAVTASTTVVLTGVGLVLVLEPELPAAGFGTNERDAAATAFWFAVFSLVPGAIGAAIFAWRTPSIAGRRRTAERPLFASAEDRRAAVARLTE